jgi:hypothetical protein
MGVFDIIYIINKKSLDPTKIINMPH